MDLHSNTSVTDILLPDRKAHTTDTAEGTIRDESSYIVLYYCLI